MLEQKVNMLNGNVFNLQASTQNVINDIVNAVSALQKQVAELTAPNTDEVGE